MLPANTSHFLQPLDHVCYANFKRKLARETYQAMCEGVYGGVDLKVTFFSLALDVERSAFTPKVIKKAFVETGIFPFNPDRIRELASINAGKIGGEEAHTCHVDSGEKLGCDHLRYDVVEATSKIVKGFAERGEAKAKKTRVYTTRVQKNKIISPLK